MSVSTLRCSWRRHCTRRRRPSSCLRARRRAARHRGGGGRGRAHAARQGQGERRGVAAPHVQRVRAPAQVEEGGAALPGAAGRGRAHRRGVERGRRGALPVLRRSADCKIVGGISGPAYGALEASRASTIHALAMATTMVKSASLMTTAAASAPHKPSNESSWLCCSSDCRR